MTNGGGDTELEQLRAEVSQLRTQIADAEARTQAAQQEAQSAKQEAQAAKAPGAAVGAPPPRRRRHASWRTVVASVLIVVGCLLAPISVLAVWSSNQISNTDRYVANVSPLIKQPAIQDALTARVSTAITHEVDVRSYINLAATELTKRGLPRLGLLISNFSGTLADGVNGFIHSTVAKIIKTPQVARLWVKVNRGVHIQLVRALSGQKNSAIVISGDQVVLSLGPIIDQVKHSLAAHGLTIVDKLPAINPTFPLFSAKYLIQAQSAYRLLNTLRWVLPLLALVLIGLGVYIARGHRRALVSAGLGVAASMLLLAIGLAIVRVIYLNKLPAGVHSPEAAAIAFDTLVRFIKQGLRVVLAVALIVALGAFFTGPSVTAVRTRQGIRSALGKLRGAGERAGLDTGPVGPWIYRHRTVLRVAAIAIAALVFAFTAYPTVGAVLTIVLVLLVVLGLIELIGRPPADGRGGAPEAVPGGASGVVLERHDDESQPAAGATADAPAGAASGAGSGSGSQQGPAKSRLTAFRPLRKSSLAAWLAARDSRCGRRSVASAR